MDGIERLANRLDGEVAQWPLTARTGVAARFDRAHAAHYRGIHGYFTNALPQALVQFWKAQRDFQTLDQVRLNDPHVLSMLGFNAYAAFGAAAELDPPLSLRYLAVARATADRLAAIKPRDTAVGNFQMKVRSAEAQSLAVHGRFAEALALQQSNVAYYRRPDFLVLADRGDNQSALAHNILGNIAVRAEECALDCRSFLQASAALARLDRGKRAIGSVSPHRAGWAENVARCRNGLTSVAVDG